MDVVNVALIVCASVLLILYVYDRIKAKVTITRDIFLSEPINDVSQVRIIVKRNDVKELYIMDSKDYCTKVNFIGS